MDLKRAYAALVELAKQENLPVETVIKDIESAIKEGYESSLAKNNYIALEAWRKIPSAGELPTAIEMVAYLGGITMPKTINRESKIPGRATPLNGKPKS